MSSMKYFIYLIVWNFFNNTYIVVNSWVLMGNFERVRSSFDFITFFAFRM